MQQHLGVTTKSPVLVHGRSVSGLYPPDPSPLSSTPLQRLRLTAWFKSRHKFYPGVERSPVKQHMHYTQRTLLMSN